MITLLFTLAAYLLGSISFAVLSSWLFGLADPRTYGSKNPGATNVLRSGNKAAAVVTLLGDAFKGWFAVYLAQTFGPQWQVPEISIALVALAVFLGHLWPVFFKFVGGKGVATALGVLLGINLWLGLACLAVWICVALIFRYSSLAALSAAVFAPFCYFFLFGFNAQLGAVFFMSMLLLYRHGGNIANLMAGKESRFGGKKVAASGPGKHDVMEADQAKQSKHKAAHKAKKSR